ncbi:MAG: MBL fold metallo-hydrolase [Planctomycetota bacterium]|nr:MBL fold metallo-hydrolase [Planctomycetota bacterium]
MVPNPPPRESSLGFLYVPPYRVVGVSVAGETTCVQIPELDICFDMGQCPRAMLSSKYVAISHGHMDHIGALAYWCSQRRFQGMGTGKIVCDPRLASSIDRMMAGFVDLERQRTPYEIVPLEPGRSIEIKNSMHLRSFETEHTAPSLGYVVVEKRSKLKPEYTDYPQEKLRELKERGVEITRWLEIPQVAYLGDTLPGPWLVRDDVRKAHVVICECTFFEPEHKERAKVGMHMHVDDVCEWLRVLECQNLVLIHVSRRTDLGFARKRLLQVAGEEKASRVLFLMDHRTNKARYERQAMEAGQRAGEPE